MLELVLKKIIKYQSYIVKFPQKYSSYNEINQRKTENPHILEADTSECLAFLLKKLLKLLIFL